MRTRLIPILISLLIVAGGWLGSQMLTGVDYDLRVIYAEYTLAATDLGHVNGELIRYRTSVIRAIESDTREEFKRIADSLPQKRARLNELIERFVKLTDDSSLGSRVDARELSELKAVQERLQAYMVSSRHVVQLMEQRWNVLSGGEAWRLQAEARQYLAEDAGSKYMSVTLELDQLLGVVGDIAGQIKQEADFKLRIMTIGMVALTGTLCMVVLAVV